MSTTPIDPQLERDRERARQALRRGVPIGRVVPCSCFRDDIPHSRGCYGVCEDAVDHIARAIAEARNE